MIREILGKWFGIDTSCQTCAVLKYELELERQLNKVLFDKLFDKDKPVAEIQATPEPMPPKRIPWAVKRQQLEAEDRRAAQVMKERQLQIARDTSRSTEEMEDLLGVRNASQE